MRPHHTNGGNCVYCLWLSLQGCTEIRTWAPKILAQFPYAHFSCVWRGEEGQKKAKSEGKSKKDWPDSLHNVVDKDGKPRAEAFDLFTMEKPGGDFSHEAMVPIAKWLKEKKAPFQWGWDLWKFDSVHFQLIPVLRAPR